MFDEGGNSAATIRIEHSLAAAMRASRPLHGVLSRLNRLLGVPVAIIDVRGGLLAAVPTRVEWPINDLINSAAAESTPSNALADFAVTAVGVDGEPAAILVTRGQPPDSGTLELAATLIGFELSRRNAELRGRRQLLAQVIEDILSTSLSEQEAKTRLARFAFEPDNPFQIIVGQADCTEQRLLSFPWNLHALLGDGGDPYLRAVLDGQVVLIAPTEAAPLLARLCHDYLSRLGGNVRVGVSNAHHGVGSFRLAYAEARGAARSGLGVRDADPHDLTATLLLVAMEAGLEVHELGRAALAPIIDHDQRDGTDLVATLMAYFHHSRSTSRTAADLYIHRNTLHHRLKLIERLLDCQLDDLATQTHLWLAAAALSLGPELDRSSTGSWKGPSCR